MLNWKDIRALIAARQSGPREPPDVLAQGILDQFARLDAMPADTPRDRRFQQQVGLEISRLRYCLAIDFGLRRGWTLSRTDFAPSVLAKGKLHGGWQTPEEWWSFTDHTYWYRRDRRAVAVATHPYTVTPCYRAEAGLWAETKGLTIDYPGDFPSWWVPGRTTLVLFTARSPRFSAA